VGSKAISREKIIRELGLLKPELAERYGVTRIGVFGSVARDEAGENSDVDIVVEMQPNLIKRAHLKVELESILGKNVDVVRYRRGMNELLKRQIDNEALYV